MFLYNWLSQVKNKKFLTLSSSVEERFLTKRLKILHDCCQLVEQKDWRQYNGGNRDHVFLAWVLSRLFCVT